MNPTAIAWTDRTWNPTTGCSKVSQGCKHCYAERLFPRVYGRDRVGDLATGTDRPRVFTDVWTHPDRLDQPLRIRKPQRIFVNSMSDLFHEDIPATFRDEVFAIMVRCQQHTFQILTKRPAIMREYMREREWPAHALDHVWLGVSVEDQETADERIPLLLTTPAAVRFVSYEPALRGVLFLESWLQRLPFTRLDWIIVGGESGPGARPFNLDWARSTVHQCYRAGVACFVKQLGSNAYTQTDHNGVFVADYEVVTKDRAGADPAEWPEALRVQEFPR